MKKIILSSILLILTVSVVLAHDLDKATQKQLDVLKKELNLTEVQMERIGHTINHLVIEEQKVLSILKDSPDMMKARLEAIKEIKIKNLQGALTPQQIDIFKSKKLEDKL